MAAWFLAFSQLRLMVTATGDCTITIDTTVPEDTASWYDLWAAAVALDGMCARNGRPGKARFLGENLRLYVCFDNRLSISLGTNRKLTVEIKK